MSGPDIEDDESLLVRAVRRRSGDRLAGAEDEVRRMLAAGLALLREHPGAAPRIADIVRRAGVSNDAFYRAFRGKDDLLAAITDDGARRLVGHVRRQRDLGSDPAERVRLCVRAILAQAGDQEVAATTRAVLRHLDRAPRERAVGRVDLERRLADLLAPPLAELGSRDPARDGLVAACAALGVMEHFLWSEREPGEDELVHLCSWVVGPRWMLD